MLHNMNICPLPIMYWIFYATQSEHISIANDVFFVMIFFFLTKANDTSCDDIFLLCSCFQEL
jgi:hypothetical protein